MTTFAGQWGPEPFIDELGNAVPKAEVTIYALDGITKATLYSDRLRAAPLTNPLPIGQPYGTAGIDDRANGLLWADPGRYVMSVKYDGAIVLVAPIVVNVDPAEQTDSDAATIAAETAARIAADTALTARYAVVPIAASGAAVSLNLATAPAIFDLTLTANCAISFVNAPAGEVRFFVLLREDAVGGRTASWTASIYSAETFPPVLPTDANSVSLLEYVTIDGGATYLLLSVQRGLVQSAPAQIGIAPRLTSRNSQAEFTARPNSKLITIQIKWSEHETAQGVFAAAVENEVIAAIDDAYQRGYGLNLRILCGNDSPSWIFDATGVRRIRAYDKDSNGNYPEQSLPDPSDANYRTRYLAMMKRWRDVLNGTTTGVNAANPGYPQAPKSARPRWHLVAMICGAMPTGTGSEMTQGFGAAGTASTTVASATLAGTIQPSAGEQGGTTFALAADPGGTWPTGQFVMRLGADDGSHSTIARRRFWEDCQRAVLPAATAGFGFNRNGIAWQPGKYGFRSGEFVPTGTTLRIASPADGKHNTTWVNPPSALLMQTSAQFVSHFKVSAIPNSGSFIYWGHVHRYQSDDGSYYVVRVRVQSSGAAIFQVFAYDAQASTFTQIGANQSTGGGFITTADSFWLRTTIAPNATIGVDFQAKIWKDGTAEPAFGVATFTYAVTDTAPPSQLLQSGGWGVHSEKDASHTTPTAYVEILDFMVGDLTGTEFVLCSARAGATVTVQKRGWMRSMPVTHTVADLVYALNAGTNSLTLDGITGPAEVKATAQDNANMLFPVTNVNDTTVGGAYETRRAIWRDGWAWTVRAHLNDEASGGVGFPPTLPVSIAFGSLWSDAFDSARKILDDPAVHSFGSRLWVGYTSLSSDDQWAAGTYAPGVLLAGQTYGCSTWAQSAGFSAAGAHQGDADTPDNAGEVSQIYTAFELILAYCSQSLRMLETTTNRYTDANAYVMPAFTPPAGAVLAAGYVAFAGGTRTVKQYLIDDANALQTRLRALRGL